LRPSRLTSEKSVSGSRCKKGEGRTYNLAAGRAVSKGTYFQSPGNNLSTRNTEGTTQRGVKTRRRSPNGLVRRVTVRARMYGKNTGEGKGWLVSRLVGEDQN